jgi:hypothetical protein
MILTTDYVLSKTKDYSELKMGDILKRKSDGCFYEIKNITYNESNRDYLYIFYGFAIKFSRSLKNHFVSEDGLFFIY